MAFQDAVPDKVAESAAAIQAELSKSVATTRGNGNLSPQGIASALAKAYLRATGRMSDLRDSYKGAQHGAAEMLDRDLFGAASSVGADAISMRDADDRASQLEKPEDALRLLQRASNNGDQVLARAIAQRAYAEENTPLGFGAWGQVLDEYVADRPAVAAKLAQLADVRRRNLMTGLGEAMIFYVPRPSELNGYSDAGLRAAADGGQAAA